MRIRKVINGVVIETADKEKRIKLSELKPEIVNQLAVYGLAVKLQRATAGIKEEKEKERVVLETAEALLNGDWERKTTKRDIEKQAKMETLKALQEIYETADDQTKQLLLKKINTIKTELGMF